MIESRFLNNETRKIYNEFGVAYDNRYVEYRNDKQEMILSLEVSIELKDWLEAHPNFVKAYFEDMYDEYVYEKMDGVYVYDNGVEEVANIDFLFKLVEENED